MNISGTAQSLAEDVERHIREALAANGHEDDARHICVHIVDDCAVLIGTVHCWAEHEDAEAAALATPAVGRVDNRLALLVNARVCR